MDEVVRHVGSVAGAAEGAGVEHVALVQVHPVEPAGAIAIAHERRDVVSLAGKPPREQAADEAGCACDEGPHTAMHTAPDTRRDQRTAVRVAETATQGGHQVAEPVQIQGSDYVGKQRNPLGVIGLGIITLGIYLIFWYFYVNKEMAEIGRTRQTDLAGDNPTLSVVAVTLGSFIFVPAIISSYMTWVRLQQASRMTGTQENLSPNIGYLLYLIPLVNLYALYAFQENMNNVLAAQGGGGGALAAGAAIPQAAPSSPPRRSSRSE